MQFTFREPQQSNDFKKNVGERMVAYKNIENIMYWAHLTFTNGVNIFLFVSTTFR